MKGGKVTLHATAKDGSEVTLDGDRLLVAVGRRPYTEGANIESLGLAMDGTRIAVDERFATSIAGGHGHVDYEFSEKALLKWQVLELPACSRQGSTTVAGRSTRSRSYLR